VSRRPHANENSSCAAPSVSLFARVAVRPSDRPTEKSQNRLVEFRRIGTGKTKRTLKSHHSIRGPRGSEAAKAMAPWSIVAYIFCLTSRRRRRSISAVSSSSSSSPPPRVRVESGELSGGVEHTAINGRPLYAFLGVPYASPPVHKNRFKVGDVSWVHPGFFSVVGGGDK